MKKFLKLMLCVALMPLFAACGDDDDDFLTDHIPGFSPVSASAVIAPPICPDVIDPATADGHRCYMLYNEKVTVINSLEEVYVTFPNAGEAELDPLLDIDYSKKSVVIFTIFQDHRIKGFDFSWGNYRTPDDLENYKYELIVNFKPGDKVSAANYALAQASIIVPKISDDYKIRVKYRVY